MKKISLATLVVLIAPIALAKTTNDQTLYQEPTFYVLGGAGNAMFDTEAKGATPLGSISSKNDNSQNSYRVAAGKMLRFGALELGYSDFGDSTNTGGTALSGASFGVLIIAPVGQSPFDFILRTDAYLLKHQYRGNEETTIPGLGYGIGTRLNWANGFFVQAQYEGLFYKDGIEGAAGGEVKTLIHHPSIQLGIAH